MLEKVRAVVLQWKAQFQWTWMMRKVEEDRVQQQQRTKENKIETDKGKHIDIRV